MGRGCNFLRGPWQGHLFSFLALCVPAPRVSWTSRQRAAEADRDTSQHFSLLLFFWLVIEDEIKTRKTHCFLPPSRPLSIYNVASAAEEGPGSSFDTCLRRLMFIYSYCLFLQAGIYVVSSSYISWLLEQLPNAKWASAYTLQCIRRP